MINYYDVSLIKGNNLLTITIIMINNDKYIKILLKSDTKDKIQK